MDELTARERALIEVVSVLADENDVRRDNEQALSAAVQEWHRRYTTADAEILRLNKEIGGNY